MRVLVVEDDVDLGTQLQKGLREHGYAVDRASDLRGGLSHAHANAYDLLLLDRMLPGGDGLQILLQLRDAGIKTPVIFLTARANVTDRVQGLDSGAEDYLIKPFSFSELLARMRVALRRGNESPTTQLQVDDLRLDPITRSVERAGRSIELTAKEFTLLHYLMRHVGQVVSRSMILEHVWDVSFGGLTNVIDVHINRLRNKIERGTERPLIHTLRGVGYVLRA